MPDVEAGFNAIKAAGLRTMQSPADYGPGRAPHLPPQIAALQAVAFRTKALSLGASQMAAPVDMPEVGRFAC